MPRRCMKIIKGALCDTLCYKTATYGRKPGKREFCDICAKGYPDAKLIVGNKICGYNKHNEDYCWGKVILTVNGTEYYCKDHCREVCDRLDIPYPETDKPKVEEFNFRDTLLNHTDSINTEILCCDFYFSTSEKGDFRIILKRNYLASDYSKFLKDINFVTNKNEIQYAMVWYKKPFVSRIDKDGKWEYIDTTISDDL